MLCGARDPRHELHGERRDTRFCQSPGHLVTRQRFAQPDEHLTLPEQGELRLSGVRIRSRCTHLQQDVSRAVDLVARGPAWPPCPCSQHPGTRRPGRRWAPTRPPDRPLVRAGIAPGTRATRRSPGKVSATTPIFIRVVPVRGRCWRPIVATRRSHVTASCPRSDPRGRASTHSPIGGDLPIRCGVERRRQPRRVSLPAGRVLAAAHGGG